MRASIGALNEYLQKASRRRDRAPSELMDAMLTAVDASNPDFTEADFTAMLAFLIFAGHETTTNLIANGVHALLTYRDQWDVLRADPSVIPNAVEELLRFRSPVQALSRSAAEDMEVDGVSVKASDTVTLLLGAANHDPARFEDPERLDVTRDDVRHIGFGLGPHFCLGAALNRMETTIALTTLTERFPDLRLGTSSPVYRPVMVFMAFESLPVVLGRK